MVSSPSDHIDWGSVKKPIKETCEHCKYWVIHPQSYHKTEYCDNDEVNEFNTTTFDNSFEPPASFGCNQWSKK